MNNADWANKDFYKVLGVAKDADQAAIKKAYRKLARENHPDGHPGDKAAEDRFKQVAEAYDVVGDAEKRKKYDEMRSMFAGAGAGGGGFPAASAVGGPAVRAAGGFDVSDLFGDMFNRGGGGVVASAGAPRRRGPRAGADLETETHVRLRRRAGRHHDQPAAELGRPLPDLLGHRRQAGHPTPRLPTCDGAGVGGQLGRRRLLDERDLPRVPRPPAGVRRAPARPATARVAGCPTARSPRASPPGSRTASGSGSRARAPPVRTAGPTATCSSPCTSRQHRALRPQGRQPDARRCR